MHIAPVHACSWALGICKNIWNRTSFGSETVKSVGVFRHFAFWRHGTRLATFVIAFKAPSNGAIPILNFLVSGRIFPTMSYVAVNKTDAIYMVCGRNIVDHVHNTSSRPGRFHSARPEFVERGEVFKQKFPRGGPSKKRVSIFFNKLLHRPGPYNLGSKLSKN